MQNCKVINDTSSVTIKEINRRKNIHYLAIPVVVGIGEEAKQLPIYIEKQDFILCKREIDTITKRVKANASNQYEMFANICKILSDYYEMDGEEIVKEARECKDLQLLCRIQGLYGLLIAHQTTCLGLSFCLYNLCKSVGIDCIVVNGDSKEKEEEGHSWNMVRLEGTWYNTDLKWDMDNLKQEKFPLNEFLKSSDDFDHRELFDYYYKDFERKYCLETFSASEQASLFQKTVSKKENKKLIVKRRKVR